jgi:hypothetical protein
MAKSPKSTSRVSNIMGLLRGNFDFDKNKQTITTQSYGSPELLSAQQKNRILSRAINVSERNISHRMTPASVLGMVQSSLHKVGTERIENRKILQLMPEVDKAARLMIASCFSPTDLTRQNIQVTFDEDSLSEQDRTRLGETATDFFQKKLNLKTAAPSWTYQFGYEAGACIFAIVPLRSFEEIENSSFVGEESFISKVVEPLSNESLFGFGDSVQSDIQLKKDVSALESFGSSAILKAIKSDIEPGVTLPKNANELTNKLAAQFIAKESLSLTDNPSILQAQHIAKEKASKKTKSVLDSTYKGAPRVPKAETIVSVSSDMGIGKNKEIYGDPILLRLPPESVTVIHTPGDPSDHVGYLVLLNRNGTPIDATQSDHHSMTGTTGSSQGNIFNQVYNAYGVSSGSRGVSNEETMSRIYMQIVNQHLHNRMDKAGYANIEIGSSDAVYRCMFARFMQAKQTRILFLPKELVTYMTLEMDQNGYGVSQLDRIKFNLGMKMAVQVSKVLAAIKAAMDRRKIDIRFTEDMMEQPEAIYQNIIREYVNKSTMSFSIDPNVIQSQIIDKSISIKGTDIPGMETFDISNEADARTSSTDFDPDLLNYIDKSIINGLGVPASTMNSLNEDEYAKSVVTTNLFFSMDVSIRQDIIIKCISDLIRKYARYSENFRKKIQENLPGGKAAKTDTKTIDDVSDTNGSGYDVEHLIENMSISLPKPNVAPSKAQFESLEAMTSAITSMVTALYPDDLIGKDDTLAPVVRLLRSKFIALNIRSYLEGSGLTSVDIPDNDFTSVLGEISTLMDALKNVEQMLTDKVNISEKAAAGAADNTSNVEGY